jgi:hypothetical protein
MFVKKGDFGMVILFVDVMKFVRGIKNRTAAQ